MAIINARMRQKRGPIAQLDKDKLLPGEFAIPEDSDKIYICIKAGVVLEIPSTQSVQGVLDTLNAVVTQVTQMIDDFRQLEIDKVGIDDNNVSTMTTYSSEKITKLINKADSAENTVTFESNDSKENVTWTDVPVLSSAEKHKSIFGKISTMFKNVRYLYKMLGTTDISSIEDGTLTGAVAKLNSNKLNKDTPSIKGVLHSDNINTGNTQLMNGSTDAIYIGNPKTPLLLESNDIETVNVNAFLIKGFNIHYFKTGTINVPANSYTTVALPKDMVYHTYYSVNCSGWSGEIFANVESKTDIFVRNISSHNCETDIEVIAFDL